MKRISLKLGNMRKEKDWVVYPAKDSERGITIQCNTRIAKIYPDGGKAILSKNCPNGAYFIHLAQILGAVCISVDPETIQRIQAAQPHSGNIIAEGQGIVVVAS